MQFKYVLLFITVCLFSKNIKAQDLDLNCGWVKVSAEPVLLDSLSVDVTSIHFPADSTTQFSYDYSTGTILIETKSSSDSIRICYRTFPFAFHQSFSHRSISEYDSSAIFKPKSLPETLFDQREELFSSDQLYKSGSLSRGISFGNNQDVFVNSNLNLQLEGKLSEDINIKAVMTDQNIPFQPEGNTQQLQDFDKVFINLYNDHLSLSAGDIVLRHQGSPKAKSYFLQYYKNVQGGMLETQYAILGAQAQTSMGISVAKGKFASIQIEPIEGVQGPYRVRGPNNERFIIILANSESVFIDGKLLQRGFNNDYVIDYNLGEITFTNRVLVTKFSRIRVDFEFSDQNYSKAIVAANHQQAWGKTRIFMNAYSEKDNRNRPLAFDLQNADQVTLSAIGDKLGDAVISTIDSVGYHNNQVLYKKVDTVDAAGTIQQILVFSVNPDSALFRAQFANVGAAKGHYIQKTTTINGRVFEWVGVDMNGIPIGDFDPLAQVATPQQKKMYTLGITQDINNTDHVYAETAFSKLDLNLYSSKDDSDNQGQAFKVGFVSKDRPLAGSGGYLLNSRIDYEFTSINFSAIDRFRYIEFDRDWSVDNSALSIQNQDQIFSAQVGVSKDTRNRLEYRLVRRKRGEVVNGFQHHVDLDKSLGRFQIAANLFRMTSEQTNQQAQWSRWSFDTHYRTKWLVPGYQYQLDRNEIRLMTNDSLIASALNFTSHKFYLRSNDTLSSRFLIDYQVREDRTPFEGNLWVNNRSQTTRLNLATDIGQAQQLELLVTYRNLENLKTTEQPRNEETVNARLDWQGSFLERHIVSELNYQIGNSRELRREFIYLDVATGEGTHTWRDEDEDGVQDLNEFYLALNPDERNYAKIFIPTDEYILAFANTFNYRLLLEMPRGWRMAHGIKKLLSRFSSNTTWNIQRKLTDSRLEVRLSPFAKSIGDEDLIASKEIFRSTWFYNRSHAKYGFDFGLLKSTQKQLLTEGFEARDLEETHFNARYSPQRTWILRLLTRRKNRQSQSDFLTTRNYLIRERSLAPELAWQPSTRFRLTGKFSHIDRKNVFVEGNGETAKIKEFTMELRHTKVQKSTLQANITFTNISFMGIENTAVGYELLQALRPGDNVLWSANWQLRIASGLQLQLHYNGRKSPESNTIHTGRMQISALF